MSRTKTFWASQHDLLLGLLAWGIGSTVVGAGLARDRSPVVRHIGLQAIGWGLIDALLAWNGRRSARQHRAVLATDSPDPAEFTAATGFQKLVALNAGLDVLYILGGLWLARTSEPQRRGAGIGITIQGLFLLIYDALLVWWSARWRARYHH